MMLEHLDCLQSAFSLKIRLVQSYFCPRYCKPRRYVTIRDLDQTRKDGLLFFLRLTPSFIAARVLGFRVQ